MHIWTAVIIPHIYTSGLIPRLPPFPFFSYIPLPPLYPSIPLAQLYILILFCFIWLSEAWLYLRWAYTFFLNTDQYPQLFHHYCAWSLVTCHSLAFKLSQKRNTAPATHVLTCWQTTVSAPHMLALHCTLGTTSALPLSPVSRDLHGFSNLCGFVGMGPMGMGMGQQIDTSNPWPTRH